MTKIKAKIYAEALYDLCEKSADLEKVLRNFVNVLAQHNQLSKIGAIINHFRAYYDKKQDLTEVVVETAKELDSETQKEIVKLVKEINESKNVELDIKIRPELLGGLILSFNDWQIDDSLKRKLLTIKNNIIK